MPSFRRRETPDFAAAFPFAVDDFFGSHDFSMHHLSGRQASASPPLPNRLGTNLLVPRGSDVLNCSESLDLRSLSHLRTADAGDVEFKENFEYIKGANKPPQVCMRHGTTDSVTGGLRMTFTKGLPPATPDIEKYYGMEQQTPAGVLSNHTISTTFQFPLNENRKRRRTTGGKLHLQQDLSSLELARLRADFDPVEHLGRGSFSEVFKVKNKIDCAYYAVKRTSAVAKNEADKAEMAREARVLAALSGGNDRCRNIVQYFNSWYEEARLHIQMELCECTVSQYLARNFKLAEFVVRDLLIDLSSALEFCHNLGFVHLDVKPDNIFIASHMVFKLGDFGLARQATLVDGKLKMSTDVDILSGDARYLAREALCCSWISKVDDISKVDIFALGATMIECASGLKLPAGGDQWHQLRDGIGMEIYFTPAEAELRDIALKLIHPIPCHRPSAKQLSLEDLLLTKFHQELFHY